VHTIRGKDAEIAWLSAELRQQRPAAALDHQSSGQLNTCVSVHAPSVSWNRSRSPSDETQLLSRRQQGPGSSSARIPRQEAACTEGESATSIEPDEVSEQAFL
jgi:hypothetical protein